MPSLTDRFNFSEDGHILARNSRITSTLFSVEDRDNHNFERKLRVWSKTGKSIDADIRALSLDAMRHAEKVRGYKYADDLIVNVIEFVEDENEFGILLEDCGIPLSAVSESVVQKWRRSFNTYKRLV